MTDRQKIDSLETKHICHRCVGETYLSNEMKRKGRKLRCSYCKEVASSYNIGELSERIEQVFGEHYVRTADEPTDEQYSMMHAEDSSYDWERAGEPVTYAIMNAADIPEAAANDIQKILEDKHSDVDAPRTGQESKFSSSSYYQEKDVDDWHWQVAWQTFERSLKTEARFFNQPAVSHLRSVFKDIDSMKTRSGRRLIVEAGPDTALSSLYRARAFQSDEKLEKALIRPDLKIGSPPSLQAIAGRMNPHGISVFYGANRSMVALSEVRPPVGSQVAVARFDIIRPVRLLDLTALSKVRTRGSIFDPDFGGQLERTMFLRSLSHRITKPVMPDDEPFEYLATQAVADFLATESALQMDGIIFPSVQTADGSRNVVLFHKAARVAEIELPQGTEITASLRTFYEEGPEPEYSVFEEVPGQKKTKKKKRRDLIFQPFVSDLVAGVEENDSRLPTLKIDLKSVTVHIIQAVKYRADKHQVNRYRWEKREEHSIKFKKIDL